MFFIVTSILHSCEVLNNINYDVIKFQTCNQNSSSFISTLFLVNSVIPTLNIQNVQ